MSQGHREPRQKRARTVSSGPTPHLGEFGNNRADDDAKNLQPSLPHWREEKGVSLENFRETSYLVAELLEKESNNLVQECQNWETDRPLLQEALRAEIQLMAQVRMRLGKTPQHSKSAENLVVLEAEKKALKRKLSDLNEKIISITSAIRTDPTFGLASSLDILANAAQSRHCLSAEPVIGSNVNSMPGVSVGEVERLKEGKAQLEEQLSGQNLVIVNAGAAYAETHSRNPSQNSRLYDFASLFRPQSRIPQDQRHESNSGAESGG